jgi:hypothetical protein
MEWVIGIFVVVVGLVVAAVVIDRKRKEKELDAEDEAEAGEDVAGLEEESVYVPSQGRDIEQWEDSRHGRYSGKSTWNAEPDEDLEDELPPSHHIREAQRAHRRRQGIGEDESGWIAESNYAAASASLADYDGDGVPDALEPDPFVYVPEDQLTQVDLHPVDESRDDYEQRDAGLSILDSGGMFEEPARAPEPAPSYDPPPSYSPDPTPAPSYDPPSSSSYDGGSSSSDSSN